MTDTSELTGSEALYGFAAWLTSRKGPLTLGATYHASPIAELVKQFCDTNKLAEPREGWTDRLTHPRTETSFRASKETGDYITWVFSLLKCKPNNDDLLREVFITEYPGCYGPAGCVVTINGSPTKGTLLLDTSHGHLIVFGYGQMVKGHEYSGSGAAINRYRGALHWLTRLGYNPCHRGY